MKKVRKLFSFLLCAALLCSCVLNITAFAATYPAKAKINSSSGVAKIYSLAGTTGHEAAEENKNKSELLCELANGTEVQILGEELDGDGDMWYKIGYGDNYQNIGYAFSSRVSIIYDYTYNEDFEQNLQNFPTSYHDALRQLHAKYPNWQFIAHNIDMSFNAAVEAQYGVDDIKNTRKWVEFTYDSGAEEWRDPRGYDEATDSWTVLETRWTYASRAAIEYFMDPRNSLDENKIFVFMLQSYNDSMYSKDQLRSVVKGTFLENGYDKDGDSTTDTDAYLDDIITAAEQSGISPYVLAATIIIEQGVNGTSDVISGTYDGFEGYYNFFNYSASGNTIDEITKSALTYAKNNGWNSRSAAIIGGAEKYADGYISVGQDTYYYKDFNVVNQIWWHQYAAALYDAWTSANFLKKGCISNTEASLIFTIPVYTDMPDTACPLPTLEQPEPDPEPELPNICDLNADGSTNNRDLALLIQYINGWDVQIDETLADFKSDGEINNKDYALLIQYINGWDVDTGANTTPANVRAENIGDTENIFNDEYVLTFRDDFDGNSINSSNWIHCPEWDRQDRGGKWDNDYATVNDGKLILSVGYDETAGCYKSGAVRTKGLFEQTYGYFECSMRVQNAPGFWCAFWMMCGKPASVGNGGTDGIEIDIMEAYDINDGAFNQALHWDRYGGTQQTVANRWYDKNLYDGKFHTYSLSWSPEKYVWYIDGVKVFENDRDDICNQPGYMKLTVEVGSWAGEVDISTLPATVEVDYVRAYQYADLQT